MQYHLEVMKFQGKFDMASLSDGETVMSRDRLKLRHFIFSLPRKLDGYMLTLYWEFSVTNTFDESQIFGGTASQEVHFLPENDLEKGMREIIKESEEEFCEHLKIEFQHANFGEVIFPPVDPTPLITKIKAFTKKPF